VYGGVTDSPIIAAICSQPLYIAEAHAEEIANELGRHANLAGVSNIESFELSAAGNAVTLTSALAASQ
jgi:hypothetical protein